MDSTIVNIEQKKSLLSTLPEDMTRYKSIFEQDKYRNKPAHPLQRFEQLYRRIGDLTEEIMTFEEFCQLASKGYLHQIMGDFEDLDIFNA